MGAWGTLHQAFSHPDIFGIVGAHSPSLKSAEEMPFLGTGAEFATKDPIRLAQVGSVLDTQQIWIDVGEDDPWALGAKALYDVLRERGIPHRWQLLPGGHEGGYWAEHALDYVRFYAYAFARQ